MIVEKMLTLYGKLLIVLYDNKIVVGNDFMIPFTQIELAEMIGSNKTTVNNLFKEFENDGLILQRKRRYYLTEKSIDIVKRVKNIKY